MPSGSDFKYTEGDTSVWKSKYYAFVDYVLGLGAQTADHEAFLEQNSTFTSEAAPTFLDRLNFGSTSGTTEALEFGTGRSFTANEAGVQLKLNLHTTLGAVPTLSVDGLAALPIVDRSGAPAVGQSGLIEVWCDGANWVVMTTPPAAPSFASGTRMLFQQSAAPTGWTKVITGIDNRALRITTGAVGSGGSVGFNSVFVGARTTTAAGAHDHGGTQTHTLSTSQMPSHSHGGVPGGNQGNDEGGDNGWSKLDPQSTNSNGGGGSHSHGIGTQAAHSHSTNLDVLYSDVIVAVKD